MCDVLRHLSSKRLADSLKYFTVQDSNCRHVYTFVHVCSAFCIKLAPQFPLAKFNVSCFLLFYVPNYASPASMVESLLLSP